MTDLCNETTVLFTEQLKLCFCNLIKRYNIDDRIVTAFINLLCINPLRELKSHPARVQRIISRLKVLYDNLTAHIFDPEFTLVGEPGPVFITEDFFILLFLSGGNQEAPAKNMVFDENTLILDLPPAVEIFRFCIKQHTDIFNKLLLIFAILNWNNPGQLHCSLETDQAYSHEEYAFIPLFEFRLLMFYAPQQIIRLYNYLRKGAGLGSIYCINFALHHLGIVSLPEIITYYLQSVKKDKGKKWMEQDILGNHFLAGKPRAALDFLCAGNYHEDKEVLYRGGMRSIRYIRNELTLIRDCPDLYVSCFFRQDKDEAVMPERIVLTTKEWDEIKEAQVNHALRARYSLVILLVIPRDISVKYHHSRAPHRHMGTMMLAAALRDRQLIKKMAALYNFPVSGLKEPGEIPDFCVQILDCNMAAEDFDYAQLLQELKPDMVCFTCTSIQVKSVTELTAVTCRLLPGTLTCAGGIHPTVEPEDILGKSQLDLVICGPGEEILVLTALALYYAGSKQEINFLNIPNTVFKKANGQTGASALREPCLALDDYPLISCSYDLLRYGYFEDYLVPFKPAALIFSSQGCSHNCIYCGAKPIHGNKMRFKKPECTLEEIKSFLDRRIDSFIVYDDFFIASKKRVEQIAGLLISERMKRKLHEHAIKLLIMTRPDSIEKNLLKKLAACGLVSISVGVETGDQALSDKLGRRLLLDKVKETARMVREEGVAITFFMMVGLPDQTWQSVFKSVRFVKAAAPSSADWSVAIPYPGTALKKHNMIRIINSCKDDYPSLSMTLPLDKELDTVDTEAATETSVMTAREIFEAFYLCNKICSTQVETCAGNNLIQQLRSRVIGDMILRAWSENTGTDRCECYPAIKPFLNKLYADCLCLNSVLGSAEQAETFDLLLENIRCLNGYTLFKDMAPLSIYRMFGWLSSVYRKLDYGFASIRFCGEQAAPASAPEKEPAAVFRDRFLQADCFFYYVKEQTLFVDWQPL